MSTKTKRFVYHYCAQYQKAENLIFVDGIALLMWRIDTQEKLEEVKAMIDSENDKILCITSLSYLGLEHEDQQNTA